VSSKPCVGCGWCCMHDQCWVSHDKYGYLPRCPDLYWDGGLGRYMCGAMDDPENGRIARRKLFEGQGCCAPLNDWRGDVKNRDHE